MKILQVVVLFVVCFALQGDIVGQKQPQFDSFEVVQAQEKEVPKLFSLYKRLKRNCREYATELKKAIEKQRSNSELLQAKKDLEGCNEILDAVGEQFGPLVINLDRLKRNSNILVEDGWSSIQITQGMVWVRQFDPVWKKLNEISTASPTEGEIKMLLNEAEAHIARNLVARTSTGYFFMVAKRLFYH